MERVGIIQMTSGPDINANLDFIEKQCALASKQGAKLVLTPENTVLFSSREAYHQHAEPLGSGMIQQRLCEIARKNQLTLIVGSMPIQNRKKVSPPQHLYFRRTVNALLTMTNCICLMST